MKFRVEIFECGAWIEAGNDVYNTQEEAWEAAEELRRDRETLHQIFEGDEFFTDVKVVVA